MLASTAMPVSYIAPSFAHSLGSPASQLTICLLTACSMEANLSCSSAKAETQADKHDTITNGITIFFIIFFFSKIKIYSTFNFFFKESSSSQDSFLFFLHDLLYKAKAFL